MIILETQEKSFVICIFKNLIATHRWVASPHDDGMKYCHWGGRPKPTKVIDLSLVVEHKKSGVTAQIQCLLLNLIAWFVKRVCFSHS